MPCAGGRLLPPAARRNSAFFLPAAGRAWQNSFPRAFALQYRFDVAKEVVRTVKQGNRSRHTRRLPGLIAVCPDQHEVKYFPRPGRIAAGVFRERPPWNRCFKAEAVVPFFRLHRDAVLLLSVRNNTLKTPETVVDVESAEDRSVGIDDDLPVKFRLVVRAEKHLQRISPIELLVIRPALRIGEIPGYGDRLPVTADAPDGVLRFMSGASQRILSGKDDRRAADRQFDFSALPGPANALFDSGDFGPDLLPDGIWIPVIINTESETIRNRRRFFRRLVDGKPGRMFFRQLVIVTPVLAQQLFIRRGAAT